MVRLLNIHGEPGPMLSSRSVRGCRARAVLPNIVYLGRIGASSALKRNSEMDASTFIDNGGRLKFNLQGMEAGIEGVTTWELRTVLQNEWLLSKTDFYLGDALISGDALTEALRPWRQKWTGTE